MALPSSAGPLAVPKRCCRERALLLTDTASPQALSIPPPRRWGCFALRRDRQRQEAVPGDGLPDLLQTPLQNRNETRTVH